MLINGAEIAVEVEGEGPAVLLVHGLGGTSNFYQVQADQLGATNHTVIRPDSAGAGRSGIRDGISVGSHADDLASILDALGIESASVVGHSMGTLIVREFANKYPERVDKLVLLGAVAEPTDAGRQAQRDRASLLRTEGTQPVASAVVANALSQATREKRPEVAAFVRELIMRQDPEGYARNCEALADAGAAPDIDTNLPLMLITGSQDKVGPAQVSQDLATRHPTATVHIIEDIGHWTALEDAAKVTTLLQKFL